MIADIFQHFTLNDLMGEKGIIVCMRRNLPEELCTMNNKLYLFLSAYDESEKRKCLEEWSRDNSKPWLVGTSSLLMGLDYPNVKHMVFFESFYSNLDLIQGNTFRFLFFINLVFNTL